MTDPGAYIRRAAEQDDEEFAKKPCEPREPDSTGRRRERM